jgi:hypothetical protein
MAAYDFDVVTDAPPRPPAARHPERPERPADADPRPRRADDPRR